ncbi:hypothetical protein N9H39_11625, partial [Gammaproteobacteria bacterium]|nr:hypothetical protein [Gammaproteobacteria bacterium]
MATRFSGADPSSLEALNNLEVLVRLDDVSERMSTIPHWVTTKVPNLTKADADTWTGNDLCCACWGWSLVLPGGV